MTQDDPQTITEVAYPLSKGVQNETNQAQSLSLATREGFLSFLIDMLEKGRDKPLLWPWKQYGALSVWAKLFADIHGWIPKTPINLTVAQHIEGPQIDYDKLVEAWTKEEQDTVVKAVKIIEHSRA